MKVKILKVRLVKPEVEYTRILPSGEILKMLLGTEFEKTLFQKILSMPALEVEYEWDGKKGSVRSLGFKGTGERHILEEIRKEIAKSERMETWPEPLTEEELERLKEMEGKEYEIEPAFMEALDRKAGILEELGLTRHQRRVLCDYLRKDLREALKQLLQAYEEGERDEGN